MANATLTKDERNHLPNGKPISKVEQYSWIFKDAPGVFQNIHKSALVVGERYQRTRIAKGRIGRITAKWSWLACGTLVVYRRDDGQYGVIDGQHRKLSADKRHDIQTLPCMVYELATTEAAAQAFLDANCERGPVKSLDKFSAMMIAGDPAAVGVRDMVAESGYSIDASNRFGTVACVGALIGQYRKNKTIAALVWKFCVELYGGDRIVDRVYLGLCTLEEHLARKNAGSIFERHNRASLLKVGPSGINSKIRSAVELHGKGGSKVHAEGIVALLNHGRSTRKIPSLFSQ